MEALGFLLVVLLLKLDELVVEVLAGGRVEVGLAVDGLLE